MTNRDAGGLYATVTLDTKDAMAKINRMGTALKRALEGKGGVSQANTSVDKLGKSTKRTTDELKKNEAAARKTEKATQQFGSSAKKAAKDTGQLGDALKGVGNNLSTTLASFGAARSGNYFYALSSGVQAVTRGFGGATASAGAAGGAIAGVAAIAIAGTGAVAGFAFGLKKLNDTSMESAQTLETLSVSFEALLGSTARARREMEFLIRAAEISPYFTEDIVALDRFLLAQGLLNDELRQGVNKSLIEFGAAAGLTGDRLRDLGYALGQVYNAGRLTGDEARQLRNNMLGVQNVLKSLPRYAEISSAELAKMMENGTITSRDFFEAFFAYTARFEDAAFKQQQTLRGLKDTIQDVFQLGLGAANLELGRFTGWLSPLENVKSVFREIYIVLKDIDFKPLIASLGALVNSVLGPIAEWFRTSGKGIQNFFEQSLPKAILFTANVVRALWAAFYAVFRAIGFIFAQVGNIFTSLVGTVVGGSAGASSAIQLIGKAALIMATPVVAAFAAIAAAIQIVIGFVKALIALLTGQGLSAAAGAAASGVVGAAATFAMAGAVIVDAWNALDALEPIEWDNLIPDTSDLVNEANRMAGLDPAKNLGSGDMFPSSGKGGDTGSGGGGGSRGADAAAKAMERAMDTLYDLTRKWFGLRSELEQGLLGDEGFEATAGQIASMGKKLVEALEDIPGAGGAIATVTAGVEQLLALVKRREELAEALKEAEKELQDAIKARDQFADKVRESALKFANSFRTEEDTVREFQQFSERGFFYETETKKQKSFLDSLKERYEAMKAFLANIATLRAAGLDEGLLTEMLAAGPEQAGEAAAQLAAGGQAMVDEVNVLQAGITATADELAAIGAEEFGQAGVDMAQATVNGIQAEISQVTAEAVAIGAEIEAAVSPWAQKMEEAGAAAGGGASSAMEAGAQGVFDTIAGINRETQGLDRDIRSNFGEMAGGIGAGLLAGEGPAQAAVESFFSGVNDKVAEWLATIDETTLQFDLGGLFEGAGDKLEGFLSIFETAKDTIVTIWNDIYDFISPIVTDIFNWIVEEGGKFVDWWNEIWPDVQEVVEVVLGIIEQVWSRVWPKLERLLRPIWEAIKAIVSGAMEVIRGVIEIVLGIMALNWENVWNGIKRVLGGVWEAISGVITGALSFIWGAITNVMEYIAETLSDIWGGIQRTAYDIFNRVIGVIEGAVNKIIQGVNWLIRQANKIPNVDIKEWNEVNLGRLTPSGTAADQSYWVIPPDPTSAIPQFDVSVFIGNEPVDARVEAYMDGSARQLVSGARGV